MPFPHKPKYRGEPLRQGPVVPLGPELETKSEFAIRMKAAPTRLELVLDSCIRAAARNRFKIHPQQLIRGYIVDSYLPELKLGFEADGSVHDKAKDAERDSHLLKSGVRIVRFSAWQLMHRPIDVKATIAAEINFMSRSLDRLK